MVYTVGETLLFRETEISNIVGKLVRIIPEGGNPAHPKWPMIEVQWYILLNKTFIFRYYKK